jgi:hypothetical protein
MISLHNIFSISKYERKTLLRSWFFRIFGILSLLVLFGMNFGMIIQGGGEQGWAVRSIPAAIPYLNLLLLNVAQAIIAVFLASDFLKRDKKLDTTEVIYMRSMTNGEYVIGKTWGNLQVFLVLNIVVVFMALIFNMLAQDTPVSWISYVVYLLLISIPTLVFIMGLSFLLMSVIRNQAITFVLILGYIGITLFLLEAKYYYIFDYMAFNIPMLISDITGMGNIEKVLIHRGIYLSLGISFIFLTIYLLKRLPQSESMTVFSLIFSIIFIGIGGYLGYRHIDRFKINEARRNEAIVLNNKYVNENLPSEQKHSVKLIHNGSTFEAVSTITVTNDNENPLEKLIFSLNGGLKINKFKVNGDEPPFSREQHLLIADQGINLLPGKIAEVEISYSGGIDETFCYLDIEEEVRQEKYGKFILNVDKRYAFVYPDYVLLTPEANWYPRTGVTYSNEEVRWNQPQFIDFDLEVITKPGLQAVSQGEINEIAPGHYKFENEAPLTQMSLAIGRYQKKDFVKDSINYGIWYIEGHDFFSGAFPETSDTITSLIDDRLGDLERSYKLDYVCDRLFLVEAPAQFKSFERSWTSRQEYIQPEQILIPEKGYLIREADLEGMKKRMERWGRRGDNNMTPKDIEMRILFEFLEVFTRENARDFQHGRGSFTVREYPNPYFVFPMLYNFQNNIQSDKWPIMNRIFEAYLKSQTMDMRSGWMRNMQGMSDDELANIALQDSTFEEILSDPHQKRIIDNVIKLKGEVLFSMVEWKAGQEEFGDFLRDVLRECRFKNIPFENFDEQIREEFKIELTPMMDDWFKAKSLPGYLFSNVEAVKVKAEEMMKTRVSLKITNFSETEGIVKLSFRLESGGRRGGFGFGPGPGGDDNMINKLIYLASHQTRKVTYMLDAEPRMYMINTLTSQNIPQLLMDGLRDIEEDPDAYPFEGEEIVEEPVQTELPGESIVDNEDPEFEITIKNDISLLERLILNEEEGNIKYSGMSFWRPPVNWTPVTDTEFYGEYVRSGYYIKSGDGSQNAKWHVPVAEKGYYDVYYHLYKPRMFRRGGRDEGGEYHFTIHGDDGAEEQTLSLRGADEGWNHLGSYYFSPDTALIELSDKSDARMVFADAVRLVKL